MKTILTLLLIFLLSSCVKREVEIDQSITALSTDSALVLVQTEIYLIPNRTCEKIISAVCIKQKVDSVLRHQYLDAKLLEIELTK